MNDKKGLKKFKLSEKSTNTKFKTSTDYVYRVFK